VILRPLTPTQIVNDSAQKIEVRVESTKDRERKSVIPHSVSESHQPNSSGKRKSEGGKKLVMLATKSDVRDMRADPNLMYFVLLYKDALVTSNDLTSLPTVVS